MYYKDDMSILSTFIWFLISMYILSIFQNSELLNNGNKITLTKLLFKHITLGINTVTNY